MSSTFSTWTWKLTGCSILILMTMWQSPVVPPGDWLWSGTNNNKETSFWAAQVHTLSMFLVTLTKVNSPPWAWWQFSFVTNIKEVTRAKLYFFNLLAFVFQWHIDPPTFVGSFFVVMGRCCLCPELLAPGPCLPLGVGGEVVWINNTDSGSIRSAAARLSECCCKVLYHPPPVPQLA